MANHYRALLFSLLAAACGDSTSPPPAVETTGHLMIRVVTSGVELDPDGYTLIHDVNHISLAPDDSVIIAEYADGAPPYQLQLSGLALNCSVSGPNPRTVDLVAGDTVVTEFAVVCTSTGKVMVRTTTTGADPTSYLYGVEIDGAPVQLLGPADSTLFHGFPAGSFPAELIGAPSNCSVAGPQTVIVVPGDTARIAFDLTCTPADPGDIAFVFEGYPLGTSSSSIYRLNRDGTGLVDLTHNPDNAPTWSPDGTRIAFIRSGNAGVSVMAWDGTAVTQLTSGFTYSRLAWSFDGAKLAFLSATFAFQVVNADGSGTVSLPTPPNAGGTPSWSPDGTRLVVTVPGGLAFINTDGSGVTVLSNLINPIYPAWSPAGDKIGFVSIPNFGLNVVNPDGTGVLNLAAGQVVGPWLSWSPSGEQIAFPAFSSLDIVNADGTGLISVSLLGVGTPVWSTDGARLTFINNKEIYSVAANGTGLIRHSARSMLNFFSAGAAITRVR